jgi:hypothetical protein
MKKRKYVRISKLSASEDPEVQTPSLEDYETLKGHAAISLPVDYWLEGYLFEDIEVGKSVLVQREIRNGLKVSGMFKTSEVVKISENTFETLFSKLKITNSCLKSY